MNSLSYQLKQTIKFLSMADINYAIIGGIAVSIYSEPRLTLDVDVNIMLTSKKIDTFLKNAKKYGFYPLLPNIKKIIRRTGVIPMRFLKNRIEGRCDFIIARNTLEYLSIKRACYRKIDSIKVKVVSPEDLVIHKITSERPRDLEDARGILIRQNKKLDIPYIKFWLKKIAESNRKPELLSAFKTLLKSA